MRLEDGMRRSRVEVEGVMVSVFDSFFGHRVLRSGCVLRRTGLADFGCMIKRQEME